MRRVWQAMPEGWIEQQIMIDGAKYTEMDDIHSELIAIADNITFYTVNRKYDELEKMPKNLKEQLARLRREMRKEDKK